jgi:hypothetical protein
MAAISNGTVLVRRECAGEVMQLALMECEEGAFILCRTEGEQTLEAYDSPWHVGGVFVGEGNLAALRQMLAGPLGNPNVPLADLLRTAFATPRVQFSDLLDLLDVASIPYEYRAFAPNKALFRPSNCAA